ncbi:pyridoxamine 5'-phosphate oxidase family protein [Haloarcula onubensis]|uniref:Pyridoxamine 5'-phosphate oxidase family protein n=1 Tax=Haloarcula onubensis TaxID=2950539 RepID=A0ABU2FM34_9EURY|nr:pyridoxamine 5'-phosphate oxidase family protein [Halomicroarcula sp. S3CR25-11]MDS0281819.1 pyridoxamine 5'-phosphate oxidase family protein [Halomicroarcula sp. S3CR25-11]
MTVEEIQLTEMDDESIRAFLTNRKMGVLGLPTDDIPYLLPMSFGYDDESTLYFTFVGGPDSRKRGLIEGTDRARFLAYAAESPFSWESVLLSGTVEAVPDEEWEDILPVVEAAWRPDVIEAAMETEDVTVYRFAVDAWTGYKHTGLPPGFDVDEPT